MAVELGVMVSVGVVWLLLALLAGPSHRDRYAREVPDAAVRVPRPRTGPTAPRSPSADLAAMLRGEVSGAEAERVLTRAAAHALPAELLIQWAERFGLQRMVLTVDSGLGERMMRRHLRDRTQPDWAALKTFAELALLRERLDAAAEQRADVR